ncbi:MAG TPA: VOC family protein, partial [Porticoccaceae bacterium]|nr:VOC family protein [Porticoccaceae bacterium]
YFDTLDSVGHYTELWDNNDVFKNMFLMVENAARNWDGADPVRPLAL